MIEFLLNFFTYPSTGDIVYDASHHHFPAFQVSCNCAFLPIPLLILNQYAVYRVAGGLSFSAITCSFFNFFPRLHENCVIFNVLSVFTVRFLPSKVMVGSGLAMTPISRRAIPTPSSFLYSSKPLRSTKRQLLTSC